MVGAERVFLCKVSLRGKFSTLDRSGLALLFWMSMKKDNLGRNGKEGWGGA